MRLFECQCCGQQLFFENILCERCGRRLGFRPQAFRLIALEAAGYGYVEAGGPPQQLRFCANAAHGVCNWLVNAESADGFCLACRHNRMIPSLSDPAAVQRWGRTEAAKHRIVCTLLRLGLPLPTRSEDPHGLAFDFLDEPETGGSPVMTGHSDGLITLNLREADDTEREKRRSSMGETYRTLLGHLRHEMGHFYWDRLVRDDFEALASFRQLFGNDQADYAAALARHYQMGPAANWQARFVSAYASAHPWEDFAETFAHYLHILDTLETAHAFGLGVHPRTGHGEDFAAEADFDPYRPAPFTRIVSAWLPIAFAVNALNRSMGQPDLYPFVLGPAAIEKLTFIHRLTHPAARAAQMRGETLPG